MERFFHIETWGCQMNVADSDRMASLLLNDNYVVTESPEEAHVIILNTCTIREKARQKILSKLGEFRISSLRDDVIIVLSGCVAQTEYDYLSKNVKNIDIILGTDKIDILPQLIAQVYINKQKISQKNNDIKLLKPIISTEFDTEFDKYSIPLNFKTSLYQNDNSKLSRFVNIIKGCNNFCTYCVVPYTRGREKSRDSAEILQESRLAVESGVQEITLLGQNVNSYGLDFLHKSHENIDTNTSLFANLLYDVSKIEGIKRLKFMTSNPHDFHYKLLNAFNDISILCDQFHLPVQSGSNEILKKMNRKYTREDYLEKLMALKKVRPEIALSTDIIVAFPGETDQDFEETLKLVKEAKYSFIFAFKYSPRKGTVAATYTNKISEDEANKRLQILLDVQKIETLKQNEAEIGKIRDVLIQYQSNKNENYWYARTFQGRLVKINNNNLKVGQNIRVKITNAKQIALEGIII